MGEMQTETVSKISNVDSRQDFMFTLIHQLGFMRLDTWGPALAVIALLEFVLFVIVLKQGARAGAAVFARGREGDNGNVQQPPKPSNRAIRLRNSGDRGRNTLCAICFRTSDLQKIRSLSEKLVQATHNAQRMRVEPFVVDTRNDIQDIPACRAALVFVDPDERLMILEDRRHHMGGDRRDTVQELLNTGSEVLLIIYDDPTEGDFGQDELYSRRLSQVRDHDLLKQLDRKGRVLSIKRGGQFKDHQKEHIVRELNRVFQ
nr:hypothetical protein BaRGS_013227 [Batillaria attramentaria]